jgi:GrpB-like predicted nucleotidyltransferase (UPF0157 family)
MSDAPVEIVEYNPQWAAEFLHEQRLVSESLHRWLVGPPEHIGSTAVPGLAAKPIVDIMAPVASLEASVDCIVAAGAIGYLHYPYKPQVMHWFCKPSAEVRTHHLHLVPLNSRLWRERLAFRDALRTHEALRAEYRELKLHLAAVHRHDREAYTDAKAPFVRHVLGLVLGTDDSTA